jgi:hypothetical protein
MMCGVQNLIKVSIFMISGYVIIQRIENKYLDSVNLIPDYFEKRKCTCNTIFSDDEFKFIVPGSGFVCGYFNCKSEFQPGFVYG